MTKRNNQHGSSVEHPESSSTHGARTDKSQRRRLLGIISAAGAVGAARLPEQWGRPVVDHVLLPAHAQMSPGTTQTTTVTCELTCTNGSINQIAYTTTAQGTAFIADSSFYVYADCVSPNGNVTRTSSLVTSSSGLSFLQSSTPTETVSSSSTFTSQGACQATTMDQ